MVYKLLEWSNKDDNWHGLPDFMLRKKKKDMYILSLLKLWAYKKKLCVLVEL